MYLFFDTETNGLPKNSSLPPTEVDNWPRVIQLAWKLFDNDGNELDSNCNLIKPNGWTIPTQHFWIDNGYSTARNMAEGVQIEEALLDFMRAIDACEVLIAHNIAFDYPIVVAECLRAKIRANNKPKQFCTMVSSKWIVKATDKRGNIKNPKLQELYRFCFGNFFDNAHDAMADVTATAQAFFHLKSAGLWTT